MLLLRPNITNIMNILIIAATKLEINNLLSKINCNKLSNILIGRHNIDIVIGGVGLVFTTYNLSKALAAKQYDLCINVGIAGSFNRSLEIGQVVNVYQDEFADMGAERLDGFQTIFDLGFIQKNEFPFKSGKLINNSFQHKYTENLQNVTAISSNTAHALKKSIKNVENKYKADIETMEGAAFFYVCLNENLKFLQIRSISNYIEENNRDTWNIPLAISKLTDFILELLKKL